MNETENSQRVKIREIYCSSALSKSKIADWTLNCYVGCEHSCRYCYARFMKKFRKYKENWGEFVDIKVNINDALLKDVKKVKKGEVFISSVCDGWQREEKKRELTRDCLEILVKNGFNITILTKSNLVKRDFDIIKNKRNVLLGITITTINEEVKKLFEPFSSTIEERLGVLEEANLKNIPCYVFFGPIFPEFSDNSSEIRKIFKRINEFKTEFIYLDILNPRWGVWTSLREWIFKKYPELYTPYKKILFDEAERRKYIMNLKKVLISTAKGLNIFEKLRFCF